MLGPAICNIVQQVGIEFCECNIVAREMYNVK
jgi:hypothetical protein